MQANFQLASVHGMLYTGGNVCFSPDGSQLYSPVHNYVSEMQLLHHARHQSLACCNSKIQCMDLAPDGDLLFVVGSNRGLGFFYSISARVVLDTISLPPTCTVACVRFSPCGRFVAVALENTLQVYTAPATRTVTFHGCHRIENRHAAMTLDILNVEWTADGEHVMLSGQDARIKIYPRCVKGHRKGMALQENSLIGHRAAVVGAWFLDDHDPDDAGDGGSAGGCTRVISVAADNVVMTWRRTAMARKEVLHAIARASVNTRTRSGAPRCGRGAAKAKVTGRAHDGDDDDDEDEEDDAEGGVGPSFLERKRLEQLKLHGVRVSDAEDLHLPDLLRYAFEVERKHLLAHKGNVSVAAFHRRRNLVAIGYNSGIFAIHAGASAEFTLVHLLSITAQSLTACAFSPSGNHIAFGSEHLKQLVVWDWNAESYVLKEQSHYYDIARTAITADAASIISGGDDGKVKIWRVDSGQCYVTFAEHTAGVTGIATCPSTNAFFTCSGDGTARGYDLVRYRHFRVYAPPEPTQLSCIAVDPSGEVLAVGSSLHNNIYLFSVQTGRVIEMLHGHEGPIACLAFHPSGSHLASGSLDKNIIMWDLFTRNDGGDRLKGDGDVTEIGAEVLCVSFSASGRRMAVLTLRQEISVFDTIVPAEPQLLTAFPTRFDAAGGWNASTNVGPNSANANAHFTTISFSPEGEKIVAGGDSKWIVLYHATQGYVLSKWPVSTNLDVAGVEEQYRWRGMSEAGHVGDIDVDDDDIHLSRRKLIDMPGSRHRHFATGKRKTNLVARTMHLAFAQTGTEFVAATTDGLLVFSSQLARPKFQPLQLRRDITVATVTAHLREGRHALALIGSLTLGDATLAVECMRRAPASAIPIAISSVPSRCIPLLVHIISTEVERSPGLQHALLWAQSVLLHCSVPLGSSRYAKDASVAAGGDVVAALKVLYRSLQQHHALTTLARENYFALQYLTDMARKTGDVDVDVLTEAEAAPDSTAAATAVV